MVFQFFSTGQRCPKLYISASMSHWMWVFHKRTWASFCAAETLVCSEGAETEGCLLTTILAHSITNPSLKENLVGA